MGVKIIMNDLLFMRYSFCFKFDKKNKLYLIRLLMQFVLTAFDGTDAEALNRRLKVRGEHLDKIALLKKSGEFIFGGAILNDDGKMIGSMIVYEFPDRQSLDKMLKKEPYVTGGVWEKIEIHPFRQPKPE
jgi:uncharacterized protein YciI